MPTTPIVSGTDYVNLPRAPESWVVEGILPTSGSLLIYGDAKGGKSFIVLQLVASIASGTHWLGFRVPQPQRVVYVQLDTPRSVWADRIEKLVSSGLPLERVLFADRETLGTFPFDVLHKPHASLLHNSLLPFTPSVVVMDTIREAHSGDENDSTAMQKVIAHLEAAVKPAALILVSHSRKGNPDWDSSLMHDNRGSNYLVGRMDAVVKLNKTSMRLTSRTMEEHSVKLQREEDGTWSLALDPMEREADLVLLSFPHLSLREQARILAERTRKTEEACRHFLRRRPRREA